VLAALLMIAGCPRNKSIKGDFCVISRKDLPEDAADWTNVSVDFERLEPDDASACPCPMEEIVEYIRDESADLDDAREEQVQFLRTAQIGKVKYWIWRYTESDGEACYLTVSDAPGGISNMGLSAANGLSPEQYMLADYFEEIYW
jgi:hypothetical protein